MKTSTPSSTLLRLTAATVFTMLVACGGDEDDREACAPIQSAIASAETAVDQAIAPFRAALTAAHATPPVAGTGACTADVNRGIATHRAVRADTIASYEPMRVRAVRGAASDAARLVNDCALYGDSERTRHLSDLQSALAALGSEHDAVLLERSRVEPVIQHGEGTFTPGRLEAQLLVWSYAESRFVCSANVTSENGAEVSVSNARRPGDYLNSDLDRRAAQGGARELRAIAP